MAYVRQHGNQLAIVSGARDSETGKVQQRVLFTFYSKDEARAAIGCGSDRQKNLFQNLMARTYPDAVFEWPKIDAAIEERLAALPEKYEGRIAHSGEGFAKAVKELTVYLAVADPLIIPSSKDILISQKSSLMALRELIDSTLEDISSYESRAEEPPSEYDQADQFHWRYIFKQNEVSPSVEEWAEGFYERQEYEMAECIFQALVSAFDNYAEGYNYLGLMALEQRQFHKAAEYFEKTVAVGKNLFPRNLPKKEYWYNLTTRPFIRGMGNLIIALLCAGEYEKAEKICNRYQKECGSKEEADDYRAMIHLCCGRWDRALLLCNSNDFVKAFALLELGNTQEALECLLLNAAEHPHTARQLLGMKRPKVEHSFVADDNNYGVFLMSQLQGYFAKQSRPAKKFLQAVAKEPAFVEMMERIDKHTFNHFRGPREEHSENFKAWHAMKEASYAAAKAKEILTGIARGSLKVVK